MREKPLILAIETSGRVGSVALALGDDLLDEITFSAPMRHSAELFPAIRSLLDRFGRKPRQIQHVYISVGPGSFTGLRIAVAAAKAIALASGAKIVAVDTLDVIAANLINITTNQDPLAARIVPILDAKRGQFYLAVYERRPSTIENTGFYPAFSGEQYDARNTKYASHFTLHASRAAQYDKVLSDSLLSPSQLLDSFAKDDVPVFLLGDGLLYHKDEFKADGICLVNECYWSACASSVFLLGRQLAVTGRFTNPLALTPNYLRRPEAEQKWQQHNPGNT